MFASSHLEPYILAENAARNASEKGKGQVACKGTPSKLLAPKLCWDMSESTNHQDSNHLSCSCAKAGQLATRAAIFIVLYSSHWSN